MEQEPFLPRPERLAEAIISPPATDFLLQPELPNNPWPEIVTTNPELQKQAALRRNLIQNLEQIKNSTSIEQPGDSAEGLTQTYRQLTELLDHDSGATRLVLYLPFELLPATDWTAATPELSAAVDQFRQSYLRRWRELLSVNDVRANFVDGDVLEPELRRGPLERVTKAAHLSPFLVEKGWLTKDELIELVRANPGSVLAQSLGESFGVLVDLNLATNEEWEEFKTEVGAEIKGRTALELTPEQISPARLEWLERQAAEQANGGRGQLEPVTTDLESTLAPLKDLLNRLETEPELKSSLYPTLIAFGSRLKGYGRPDADLDYAVLVKPHTPFEQRPVLQPKIGPAVEFWLEEKGDRLGIQNFARAESHLADSRWAHVLFNGTWYGQPAIIKELYEKLLTPYLYAPELEATGRDEREIWLEEMEKDAIQYRLLHSGYDRYFPPQNRLDTAHSQLIDGQSAFYDSGFRHLATKLFLNRVFLPRLEKSN